MSAPYAASPIFDDQTLPAALRNDHRTKTGTWGLLRVLDGEVRLGFVVLDDLADGRQDFIHGRFTRYIWLSHFYPRSLRRPQPATRGLPDIPKTLGEFRSELNRCESQCYE